MRVPLLLLDHTARRARRGRAARSRAGRHASARACWKGSGWHTRRLTRGGTPSLTGNTAPPQLRAPGRESGARCKLSRAGQDEAGKGCGGRHGCTAPAAQHDTAQRAAGPLKPAARAGGSSRTGVAQAAGRAPAGRLVELRHVHALHGSGQAVERGLAVQALGAAGAQALPNLHQQLLAVAQGKEVAKVGKGLCRGAGGMELGCPDCLRRAGGTPAVGTGRGRACGAAPQRGAPRNPTHPGWTWRWGRP